MSLTIPDIETSRLKLVAQSVEQTRSMIDALNDEQRSQVSAEWLALLNSPDVDYWTLGFLIVEGQPPAVIGTCGFKGPPSADQMVEVAYSIDPEYQGRGFATEAAEALTAFAFNHDSVRVVRAHTIAPSNASTRVLIKCGFQMVGNVIDPEDGLVYRWERLRPVPD